jgi:D-alanyl-D-alanine carboxypeptidase
MAAYPAVNQRGVDYEQILIRNLTNSATPGAAIVLLVDGQPIYVAGIGSSDPQHLEQIDANAQFYVYSTAKTMLAIAAMRLVEQGRLRLDAPVHRYLPTLLIDAPVTVRQLLNHSGGIPDYGGMPEYSEAIRAHPEQPWSPEGFLERVLPRGVLFEPGGGWAYSNISYLIVRLLLERLHHQPLRVILQKDIFEPLGLRRTFVADSLDDAAGLTPGFSAFFTSHDRLENITRSYHPGWVSHGAVVSTAMELAAIYDALFAGRLLTAESVREMLEPVVVPFPHPLFRQPAYGLGLMIDARSTEKIFAGHGGGGPGYSIGALHFEDSDGRSVTCAACANRDQPDLGLRLAFAVAETVRQPRSAS